MLISQQHRAVILRPRDPNRILTVIPTARLIHYQGQPLVAVPHRVAEARVLNNLNIRVPSPIRFHYDWPSRYPGGPFEAQRVTAEFLTLHARAFVLNEMGTGKTLAGLWAADYLMHRKVIQSALVVCPRSTLHETWESHIREHFLTRSVAVLHGSAAKRRRLLAQPHDFYLINHDGVEVVRDELVAHGRIGLAIVDELAEFSNARAGRWEALRDVVQPREWVWGFTGTPTPHAPTDAWAQVKLIKPENVPKRFTRFRDATMLQQSTYRWVPRDTALEVVHTAMQPALRFKRADCLDLPECTYTARTADLTPEQTKAYKELLKEYATEYAEDKITAANEGVKRGKLIQVLCGAVYSDSGGVLHLPCGPRLKVVEECIREAPSKVIIFAPLVAVVQMLLDWLGKQYETAAIWGDTPGGRRKEILQGFQHSDKYRVLVAHPQTMAHGLTLTAAATSVWYGPTSNRFYEQANARITRPGQKLAQTIVHIVSTALERTIYQRLQEKKDIQGVLLGMLEETGRKAHIH